MVREARLKKKALTATAIRAFFLKEINVDIGKKPLPEALGSDAEKI